MTRPIKGDNADEQRRGSAAGRRAFRSSRVFATLLIGVLSLNGCGSKAEPERAAREADQTGEPLPAAEAGALACQRDEIAPGELVPWDLNTGFVRATAEQRTPFRCLRLLAAAEISSAGRELNVVNIGDTSAESGGVLGQLRIPLHEIKTKGFLRGRPVAIVSSGKQYAPIEKECGDIKAAGIDDVIAVIPDSMGPIIGSGDSERAGVPAMTPLEFVSERAFGVWHVVDMTSGTPDRKSLSAWVPRSGNDLASAAESRHRSVGLERTLLVFGNDSSPGDDALRALRASSGQTFVLAGGLAGLQRYQAEAAAMVRALEGPRINQRGCAG